MLELREQKIELIIEMIAIFCPKCIFALFPDHWQSTD